MDKFYVDTVRLLLTTLPEVFALPKFALKGGTALNLFVQSMPRLSVDIDVVFTDHLTPRTEALKEIAAGLRAAQRHLKARGIDSELITSAQGEETKLFNNRLPHYARDWKSEARHSRRCHINSSRYLNLRYSHP